MSPCLPIYAVLIAAEHIMVDPWEAGQRQYTRTLVVLQQLQRRLRTMFVGGSTPSVQVGCRMQEVNELRV
jgi:hypothetical protein